MGMKGGHPIAVRVYRRLVGLVPGEIGGRYADDATDVFAQLYAEARLRGRRHAWATLLRSGALLGVAAVRERSELGRSKPSRRANRMMELAQDFRFSMRALWKRPGFTIPAVLILAAGIGATTTIFSVVDTVVLRELPYPSAGRLVFFENGSHSFPNFHSWEELSAFERVGALRNDEVDLIGDGPPDRLGAAFVSPTFFPMLGGGPALGRLFDGDDFRDGSNVVVLSWGAWQRRFGGDPDVVGRTLRIDGEPRLVVGVLAKSFDPPALLLRRRADVWFPLGSGGEMANDRRFHVLGIVARLADGTSLEAAQSQIDAQRAAEAEQYPDEYRDRDGQVSNVPLVPLREATVRQVRSTLFTLLGAVALLLLIACANVANLFLARGTSRTREIALRSALGASRFRVAAQVLSEGAILALLGGVIGVGLAYAGVAAFQHFNPGGIPRLDRLAVDPRILGFTLLVSIGTALLFGTLPALQAAHANVNDALKEGSASVTANRSGRRARNSLVVTEIALAVVLMTGATLLFRTFIRTLQVDPGFEPEGLVVLPLDLNDRYSEERRLGFTREVLESIRRIPGVTSAAAGATLPFTYTGSSRCCWSSTVKGDPARAANAEEARPLIHPITSSYFATLHATMEEGREFSAEEDAGAGPPVAILNDSAAHVLFGDADALGRQVSLGDERLTVVGIESGVHHWGLNQSTGMNMYVTHARNGGDFRMLNIAVRSSLPIETLAPRLRDAVWALEPDLPIGSIETMEQRVSKSLATPRFLALLFSFFAAVSLILACAGIYSSMLYTVGQRRREMGIRLAMGARGGQIVRMVLRSALLIAILGVTIGIATAIAASRVIESALWNVAPTDPLSYGAAAMLLGGTALLACFIPAVKASRADPMTTLRTD
jgi:putative ABC transport system permease protein